MQPAHPRFRVVRWVTSGLGPGVASLGAIIFHRGAPVLTNLQDEIVEDRTWRNGIEIISHVNWTQVAKVRRSLGISAEVHIESPVASWALAGRTDSLTSGRRRSARPRFSKKLHLVVGEPELRRSTA